MDETIGTRINQTRTDEALHLAPTSSTAACPFCIVMLSDGVAQRQQHGTAAPHVAVSRHRRGAASLGPSPASLPSTSAQPS